MTDRLDRQTGQVHVYPRACAPRVTYRKSLGIDIRSIHYISVIHTENVARGSKLSFRNVGGGKGVYNVLTFQNSRGGGARAHLGGANAPPPPLNETMYICYTLMCLKAHSH